MADKENKLILYKDDEGKLSVNTLFADEDVWLTQAQLAEIYNTTQQNISLHQKGIYADGELEEEATHKKYLLVRQEGNRQVKREIDHYNLDMIIALGYRVQSPIAVRFRRWATQRLHEYIQKGFTMDDERLNLLTSQFLDFAEFQALEQNPMTMADWVAALDDQILRLRKNILEGTGTVSHQEAIEKAEHEFEIYREREMRLLESDFDKAVKGLLDFKNNPENEDET